MLGSNLKQRMSMCLDISSQPEVSTKKTSMASSVTP